MIKKVFEKVNEEVFYEKLDNGIDVYLYPSKKTKNFYISISVKYGARITKYNDGKNIIDVIPGSAHFLEHKVMALSENPEISNRINEMGSIANAWTSYYGTNYNIFGSININENLKLLLDIFYNTDINEKNVNEEKGIIGEEIDMYKDQLDSLMFYKLYDNLFTKSYVKNTVVGERSDIEKITASSLNKIYDDYYTSNNTFIIVTGDFDQNDMIKEIKDYMSNLKLKEKNAPKRIKEKETDRVGVILEEINKDVKDHRVKYAIKIPKKQFNIKDDNLLRNYINIILSSNFSATSKLFEKYKNEGIIIGISANVSIIDDYVIITVSAMCKDANVFIDNISKDIKTLALDKNSFERKKKLFIRSYILDFDNIEDVEYNICNSLMIDNKVDYNEYSSLNNMNYDEALGVLNNLSFDNISIVKAVK